jgi:hypothetical protein
VTLGVNVTGDWRSDSWPICLLIRRRTNRRCRSIGKRASLVGINLKEQVMKKLLEDHRRQYELYEDDAGQLVLNVLCGMIGEYEAKIPLNAEEVRRYHSEGKDYLDALACSVSHNTKQFEIRMRPQASDVTPERHLDERHLKNTRLLAGLFQGRSRVPSGFPSRCPSRGSDTRLIPFGSRDPCAHWSMPPREENARRVRATVNDQRDQGNRILFAVKTSENPFQNVSVPSCL